MVLPSSGNLDRMFKFNGMSSKLFKESMREVMELYIKPNGDKFPWSLKNSKFRMEM